MYIGFPKTKNGIAALSQIGVTSLIPADVLGLNFVQFAGVFLGFGVPKVAIPLNDEPVRRHKGINNELIPDKYLGLEINPNLGKESVTGNLKFSVLPKVAVSKALHRPYVSTFVATEILRADVRGRSFENGLANRTGQFHADPLTLERTIDNSRNKTGLLAIHRLFTGYANHGHAVAALIEFLLAMVAATVLRLLPEIAAVLRAKEWYRTFFSRQSGKFPLTVFTGISAAIVAYLTAIYARPKLPFAPVAGF